MSVRGWFNQYYQTNSINPWRISALSSGRGLPDINQFAEFVRGQAFLVISSRYFQEKDSQNVEEPTHVLTQSRREINQFSAASDRKTINQRTYSDLNQLLELAEGKRVLRNILPGSRSRFFLTIGGRPSLNSSLRGCKGSRLSLRRLSCRCYLLVISRRRRLLGFLFILVRLHSLDDGGEFDSIRQELWWSGTVAYSPQHLRVFQQHLRQVGIGLFLRLWIIDYNKNYRR